MLIINQLTFAFFLNRIYSMSAFDFVLFFFPGWKDYPVAL